MKWPLSNFEGFYRNFTGILKDGEWNFKKAACISVSIYNMDVTVNVSTYVQNFM